MSDQDSAMPHANPPFWIGLSLGSGLFLAGFIAWAAVFGIGGGPSPNQQQASGASQPASQMRDGQTRQTTGQAPATAPMQREQK